MDTHCADPDPVPNWNWVQNFDDQKIVNFYSCKKLLFLWFKNCNFCIPVLHEGKNASALKREHTAFLKHDISSLFLFFWGLYMYALLDPDPADQNQCGYIRIWIHNIENNTDFWFTTATYCKLFSENWSNLLRKVVRSSVLVGGLLDPYDTLLFGLPWSGSATICTDPDTTLILFFSTVVQDKAKHLVFILPLLFKTLVC